MKKIVVLLLAVLAFSCSDDEKETGEGNRQWSMIFNENVKNDSKPVDKTEKFTFDGECLIQHIIKQRYFEEEISHEVNLSYSDNLVTVASDYLTLIYTLNSEGYASQCTYTSSSQNRIYLFSYSIEGYLTGITESIDGTEYSSTSLTYDNGDITSISSTLNGFENKFIYEPGEESSKYHLPCLGLLEIHPLTFHIEALYAGLLGKAPRHFTARSFPAEGDNEQTIYTYEFDKEGNPQKMGCQTTYAKGESGYYPYTRNISISFE
jgi:hypothetical protein